MEQWHKSVSKVLALGLLFVSLAATQLAFAQTIVWERVYGVDNDEEHAYDVVLGIDGAIAVALSTSLVNYRDDTALLLLNSDGTYRNHDWAPEEGSDRPASIIATSDGGYAMAGDLIRCESANVALAMLTRFDADGNFLWYYQYDPPNGRDHIANDVLELPDGGFVILGQELNGRDLCEPYIDRDEKIYLQRTDASGNPLWHRYYRTPEYNGSAGAIITTHDGGYALACTVNLGSKNPCVLKLDANFDVQWLRIYDAGQDDDTAADIIQTADGGYAVVGASRSFGSPDGAVAFLLKLSPAGDVSWYTTYALDHVEAEHVRQTADDGYVISVMGNGTDSSVVWLLRTDATGTILWDIIFDGKWRWQGSSGLALTSDGDIILAATEYLTTADSFTNSDKDVWVARVR